jgi:hypothetical protein
MHNLNAIWDISRRCIFCVFSYHLGTRIMSACQRTKRSEQTDISFDCVFPSTHFLAPPDVLITVQEHWHSTQNVTHMARSNSALSTLLATHMCPHQLYSKKKVLHVVCTHTYDVRFPQGAWVTNRADKILLLSFAWWEMLWGDNTRWEPRVMWCCGVLWRIYRRQDEGK